MESWHVVGQKVVCIDGARHPGCGYGDEIMPVSGKIYTVRAVDTYPTTDHRHGNICFLLEEIRENARAYDYGVGEPRFAAARFRPVRTTSIECFRSLLNPTPEQVREMEDA